MQLVSRLTFAQNGNETATLQPNTPTTVRITLTNTTDATIIVDAVTFSALTNLTGTPTSLPISVPAGTSATRDYTGLISGAADTTASITITTTPAVTPPLTLTASITHHA